MDALLHSAIRCGGRPGQFAMAVAKARPPSGQSSIGAAAQATGSSKTRVGQASVVVQYAPELADSVLAGSWGRTASRSEVHVGPSTHGLRAAHWPAVIQVADVIVKRKRWATVVGLYGVDARASDKQPQPVVRWLKELFHSDVWKDPVQRRRVIRKESAADQSSG